MKDDKMMPAVLERRCYEICFLNSKCIFQILLLKISYFQALKRLKILSWNK